MKNILIITGDPNSINSEIIIKVWKKMKKTIKRKTYFISNYNLLKDQFRILNFSEKITKKNNLKENDLTIKVLNVDLTYNDPFNVPANNSSKYIRKSLEMAHSLALSSNVAGIINCPIDKKLLNKKNYGVTEFLASKCKIKDKSEVMLIGNKELFVCPITTHIDVKNISKKINMNLIIKKSLKIDNWFKKKYKKRPKIAILGLNPHNAEFKKNSEEERIIKPAIKKLKKFKLKVDGPLVADTVFIDKYKNYNVIIGMYHDQVLAPFKSIYKFNAINITIGLKYSRVSPDHGVAINLIRKNKANEESLMKCIDYTNNL
jgi:4-hydroxy-L-threonine phosphate dehydrogenase PdxA